MARDGIILLSIPGCIYLMQYLPCWGQYRTDLWVMLGFSTMDSARRGEQGRGEERRGRRRRETTGGCGGGVAAGGGGFPGRFQERVCTLYTVIPPSLHIAYHHHHHHCHHLLLLLFLLLCAGFPYGGIPYVWDHGFHEILIARALSHRMDRERREEGGEKDGKKEGRREGGYSSGQPLSCIHHHHHHHHHHHPPFTFPIMTTTAEIAWRDVWRSENMTKQEATHTHTHIYIYIYIYRERERERDEGHPHIASKRIFPILVSERRAVIALPLEECQEDLPSVCVCVCLCVLADMRAFTFMCRV